VADSGVYPDALPEHAHFDSIERRRAAGRLAMWAFLASEVLFFGGLFTLYFAYRARYPHGFASGIQHNTLAPASINTLVLLVSSYAIAVAVHDLKRGLERRALRAVTLTGLFGTVFLALKGYEYSRHFAAGVFPGGGSSSAVPAQESGIAVFHTLYFGMTGLHALHVLVGIGMLGIFAWQLETGHLTGAEYHRLEIGALYWHLVDIIWLFLWPLFYLTGHGA
jgi:cytochrome c oxidase subunit III